MNDDSIELHDLKAAWARLEERFDVNFGKVERLARELAADKTRTLARRATWLPWAELVTEGLGLALVIAGFSVSGSPVYFGCLWFVAAVLALLMGSAIAQIAMLRGLDPASPVLTAQRQLAKVSALRIGEWKWVLLLSPVLWTPFLVAFVEVPLRLLAGDAMHTTVVFTSRWVQLSLLVGAVTSGLLYGLCRWLAPRLAGTSFLRSLVDDFAGRRLVAAREFLLRLDGFERG